MIVGFLLFVLLQFAFSKTGSYRTDALLRSIRNTQTTGLVYHEENYAGSGGSCADPIAPPQISLRGDTLACLGYGGASTDQGNCGMFPTAPNAVGIDCGASGTITFHNDGACTSTPIIGPAASICIDLEPGFNGYIIQCCAPPGTLCSREYDCLLK